MTIDQLRQRGFDQLYMLPNYLDTVVQRNRLIASGIEYDFAEATEDVGTFVLYVLAAKRITPTLKATLRHKKDKTVLRFIQDE